MPTMKEEITAAIAAHGMWKARLRTAIDSGKLETPVATIQVDNQCAFGKWLYGTTIPADVKSSEHYKKVRELHAQFHKAAGRVAELASTGKKTEAEKSMGVGGEYADVSGKLTYAMMEWNKTLP